MDRKPNVKKEQRCDYPWSQGSKPEWEDRGQKQLCFTYHGVRIKLDDGLCCWDGSKRYFIIRFM